MCCTILDQRFTQEEEIGAFCQAWYIQSLWFGKLALFARYHAFPGIWANVEKIGFHQPSGVLCSPHLFSMVSLASGKCFLHARWVKQGDPLSPLLFLLAIEPLHKLFQLAQQLGIIQKLQCHADNFRIPLYADDAALFIKPTIDEILATKFILQIFGDASGLITNMEKTEFFPTWYEDLDLQTIIGQDQNISQFPCSYHDFTATCEKAA